MARLIALEWDAGEARIVAARRKGREVMIDEAFSVELAPRDSGSTGRAGQTGQTTADTRVGEKLASALAARGLGKADALVAVGRASIELRVLETPPAPEEELADMVRFQAMRQFNTLDEDWPLDFAPLDAPASPSASGAEGESTGRTVLAAAISPELVQQIQDNCQTAGVNVKRMVLRPFAAASLLTRKSGGDIRRRLMVDLLADEVDLTILTGGQVVFLRTVRLPAAKDPDQHHQSIIREIRRTMAAAQNQLGRGAVEEIVLCGSKQNLATLEAAIEESSLSLPVECFDPFSELPLSGSLDRNRPDYPGRYAPLLGMLVDETAGIPHAIDFLHPRKRPQAVSNKLRYGLWAALAGSVAVALAVIFFWMLASKDADIAQKKKELEELDTLITAATKIHSRVAQVDEFVAGDITWIDELYELCEEMPKAEDVVLTQVDIKSSPSLQIVIDGRGKTDDTVHALERNLRDDRHIVQGTGMNQDARRRDYIWGFRKYIDVKKPESEKPVNEKPVNKKPAKDASAENEPK